MSDLLEQNAADVASTYEMSTMSLRPGDASHLEAASDSWPAQQLSTQSSMAALHVVDPQEGVNVQELPPVDKGFPAWSFCAASFVLEIMVWGFSFRLVVLHPPLLPVRTDKICSYGIFQGISGFLAFSVVKLIAVAYRLLHLTSPVQQLISGGTRRRWNRCLGFTIWRG